MTERVPVPRWVVVLLLSLAIGVGAVGGSLAVGRQGQRVPILMAAESSLPQARVSFESGFVPVVKRALPAVVNVSSSKTVRTSQNMHWALLFNTRPKQGRLSNEMDAGLWKAVGAVEQWPAHDLFTRFE